MFVDDKTHKLAFLLCTTASRNADMTPAAARVGAWLVGHAEEVGGLPFDTSYRQIKAGTGCHHHTLRKAVEWLSDHGVISVSDGKVMRAGATAIRVDVQ